MFPEPPAPTTWKPSPAARSIYMVVRRCLFMIVAELDRHFGVDGKTCVRMTIETRE